MTNHFTYEIELTATDPCEHTIIDFCLAKDLFSEQF
jgi:hypothetical protein